MSLKLRLAVYLAVALWGALGLAFWYWPVGSAEISVYSWIVERWGTGVTPLTEYRTELPDDAGPLENRLDWCFKKSRPAPQLVRAFEASNRWQASIPKWRAPQVLPLSSAHGPSAILTRILAREPPTDCLNMGLDSHMRFSRVGFAPNGSAALVYAEFHCALCGYGGYLHLRRTGEQWELADECTVWVS